MSEIEKMYENARVYDFRYDCNVSFADGDFGCITNCSKGEVKDYCTDKKYFKDAKVIKIKHLYPPFTAEKQIKLIKFLLKNYEGIDISKKINRFNFLVDNATFIGCHHNDKSFEESLAGVINKLWVDMPEEEKQQVKGILE